jgi:hypothetical protein
MAGASTAALAGALALIGIATLPAVVVAGVLGPGQAVTLSEPAALYGGYAETALTAAIWIAVGVLVVARALSFLKGSPLTAAARLAIGASAALLWLELLALLHPLKPLVDALFQAHRLEWVMAGRYFFTQPMPDGVEFPYAIALYAFAAPWTLVSADHVALLRVVVMTLQAIAGACLYPMAARVWEDRRAGVVAVLLFHLIPLPYVVIGNGNLTNMFGQSVALASIAIIVVTAPRPSRVTTVAALSLVVALGLLAHVSTFGLLSGTLVLVAALYAWRGGAAGRASAVAIAVAATLAAVLSVALYYRHFGEVYAHAIERVAAAPAPVVAEDPQPAAPDDERGPPGPSRLSRARLTVAAAQTAANIGWPVLVLAIAAAPAVVRARDRLSLAVTAWVALWVLGTVAVLMTRVGPEFERYAVEFLGRINLATYPAAVLLAARACSAAWSGRHAGAGGAARAVTAGILLAWAATIGIDSWLNWMR